MVTISEDCCADEMRGCVYSGFTVLGTDHSLINFNFFFSNRNLRLNDRKPHGVVLEHQFYSKIILRQIFIC